MPCDYMTLKFSGTIRRQSNSLILLLLLLVLSAALDSVDSTICSDFCGYHGKHGSMNETSPFWANLNINPGTKIGSDDYYVVGPYRIYRYAKFDWKAQLIEGGSVNR